jgi:hypothetical protein
MRRTPIFRALSALLALWFALGLVEASALHGCPMHDGVMARASESSPAPAGGHGAHATSGVAATDAPPPPHGESHPCTCLGDCGVAIAIAAPGVRIVAMPTVVAEGRPAVLRSRVGTRSATSHLLPPATAPPVRVG